MEIVVLHNRTSGDQDPSPGRLLALLRREGYQPHYFDLNAALENPAQLPEADFIVIAGGDGSFRRAALKLAPAKCPFALLPVGTANNIARSLGIEGSAADVIASWDRSDRRRFDLGVARGPWGEERFVEGVGVGLFGRIISILQRVETPPAHSDAARPHRVASDLRSTTVLAHEMEPVLVEAALDGERVSGQFLLLEAMNIGRVGAGIEVARDADTSDGLFEVVMAQLAEREKLLDTLGNVAREVDTPSLLTIKRCRHIELILPPCEFRLDDRAIPLTDPGRVDISMAPDAIEVLVPHS